MTVKYGHQYISSRQWSSVSKENGDENTGHINMRQDLERELCSLSNPLDFVEQATNREDTKHK